jgi:hypothetical protein
MEGMLICSFLTTSLALTMLGIWTMRQIPNSLAPSTYVRIHTEQHSVLNGLKYYGYAGIDDSSKVHHLLKGIKTTELDVCKTQVMASPSLYDDFAATVELYSTFIKKMKAETLN